MKVFQVLALLVAVAAATATQADAQQTSGPNDGPTILPDYLVAELEETFEVGVHAYGQSVSELIRCYSLAAQYPQYSQSARYWETSLNHTIASINSVSAALTVAKDCKGQYSATSLKLIRHHAEGARANAWNAWYSAYLAESYERRFQSPAYLAVRDSYQQVELLIRVTHQSFPGVIPP